MLTQAPGPIVAGSGDGRGIGPSRAPVRATMLVMRPGEIVTRFIRAVEANDLDAALDLVHPDVEYDNVPSGKVHGPDGIRRVLEPFLGACSAVEWVVHHQVEREDGPGSGTVMNERLDRFCTRDHWIEIPVAGLFVLQDGRISLWRDYFDEASYRAQIP